MGSDILCCEYAPSSSATPRCVDVGILYMYYRPIEAGSTPVCLRFSHPSETRIPCGQDRLTEVGHTIDSGIFQALSGFVLSMCRSIAVNYLW